MNKVHQTQTLCVGFEPTKSNLIRAGDILSCSRRPSPSRVSGFYSTPAFLLSRFLPVECQKNSSVGIYQATARAPYYELVKLQTDYIIASPLNNTNKFHPILEIISRESRMISRFIITILTFPL